MPKRLGPRAAHSSSRLERLFAFPRIGLHMIARSSSRAFVLLGVFLIHPPLMQTRTQMGRLLDKEAAAEHYPTPLATWLAFYRYHTV